MTITRDARGTELMATHSYSGNSETLHVIELGSIETVCGLDALSWVVVDAPFLDAIKSPLGGVSPYLCKKCCACIPEIIDEMEA